MHAVFYGDCPKDIKEIFKRKTAIKTRAVNSFELPRPNSEHGRNSIGYRRPLKWNNLPSEVQSITKIDNFKNKLKRSRLENICYEKELQLGQQKFGLLLFLVAVIRLFPCFFQALPKYIVVIFWYIFTDIVMLFIYLFNYLFILFKEQVHIGTTCAATLTGLY